MNSMPAPQGPRSSRVRCCAWASGLVSLLVGSSPAPAAARGLPPLAEVLERARARAPEAVVVRGQAGVARAGYAGATLSPITNPYLELLADRGSAGTADLTLSASLWLPIEVSGQRTRRIRETDALVSFRDARVEETDALVSAQTVRAYGGTLVGAERVRLLEEILASVRDEAAHFEARVGAGDLPLQDGRLAALEVARIEVQLAEARAGLARVAGELEALTGVEARGVERGVSLWPPRELSASEPEQAPAVRAARREAEFHARAGEREAREAHQPLSVIVTAARGDLAEARVGAGLAWTLPVLRTNQGARARATAERQRALDEADARQRQLVARTRALQGERAFVVEALRVIEGTAEPAARANLEASAAVHRAGKGELLRVITARRDLQLLRVRRLDLVERLWTLDAERVAFLGMRKARTGETR